jgi:hypothetical protein
MKYFKVTKDHHSLKNNTFKITTCCSSCTTIIMIFKIKTEKVWKKKREYRERDREGDRERRRDEDINGKVAILIDFAALNCLHVKEPLWWDLWIFRE